MFTDNQMTIEESTRILLNKGINPTHQRIEIGCMLFGSPKHVSADQIMDFVAKTDSKISKATVYNTLGLFSEKGLLNEVTVDPQRVFYDTRTVPHQHFYNVDTGELTDIPTDSIELGNLPESPEGTAIEDISIVVHIRNKH